MAAIACSGHLTVDKYIMLLQKSLQDQGKHFPVLNPVFWNRSGYIGSIVSRNVGDGMTGNIYESPALYPNYESTAIRLCSGER